MAYVLCCVDSENYSQDVCDYAVMLSNNLQVPLKFLNIVEHSHKSKDLNLSGNITLGERDDILEKLTNEEYEQSKCNIKAGKEILEKLKQRAADSCENEVIISQRHGEVEETILELEDEIETLVIGLKSNLEHLIGEHVKDIIRSIHKPVLLVNSKFVEPKKLMIAYNGSNESKKLLENTSKRQIFKNVSREIVNLSKDETKSNECLKEAKSIFAKNSVDVETKFLKGDNEDTLLEYFDNSQADVLAMGAYGHSKFKELFFGSFTSKILTKMKKPILLFR